MDTFVSNPMQILFGGTFDPVHQGHLAVALVVAEHFNAPVTLLPNAQPPHKSGSHATSQHRLAMLERAIAPYPTLAMSAWELQQPTPSWTLNTLKHWRSLFPTSPLVWVIGEDSLSQLHHWYQWQEFSSLCHLAVLPRQNARPPTAAVQAQFPIAIPSELHQHKSGLRVHLPMDLHNISSTEVRQQLRQHHYSPAIPTAVMAYIQEHGLYGVPTA